MTRLSETVYQLADFASVPMTHRYDEPFAAPMVTNWRAEAQVCNDPTAYRMLSAHPVATAEGDHAQIYLRVASEDRIYPLHALGQPITHVWRPDRVERRMQHEGLEFRSITALAPHADVLLIDLQIRNRGAGGQRSLRLFLRLLAGVERLADTSVWNTVATPVASARFDQTRNAFVFGGSGATSVQGVDPKPLNPRSSVALAEWVADANMNGIVSNRIKSPCVYAGFEYALALAPGDEWRLRYVHALSESEEGALRSYDEARSDFASTFEAGEREWAAEISAAFTPRNDRFSGWLPTLSGVHPSVSRVYLSAASNLLFMRRSSPGAVLPRVYKTLSPRSGPTCWLWDTQQAASGLALLDPAVLKQMAEWWLDSNIHGGWATNYLTGRVLGTPYSVNDFALFSIIHDLLRYTGDRRWLHTKTGDTSVLEHLRGYAGHWKELSPSGFLADYGEAKNLLECVPTYRHRVASLNAANAWMSRLLAVILRAEGQTVGAVAYEQDAAAIARAVVERLYAGDGTFACEQHDGTLQKVAHCYDFAIVMSSIGRELPAAVREQMVSMFLAKLRTPSWMRALAADDPAAGASLRTDHTATGAYASWPALALRGLCDAGRYAEAIEWIGKGNPTGGIASVAAQGPFGQGTFHGDHGSPLEGAAARKAPDAPPHYEEWIDIAAAGFIGALFEGLFGVRIALFEGITVDQAAWSHHPGVEIRNLGVQGRNLTIRDGRAFVEPVR